MSGESLGVHTQPAGSSSERPMTDRERHIRQDWQTFAMDCLTDDQVAHCGHLDMAVIVVGCEFCEEIVAHQLHDESPDRTCEFCEAYFRCRCRSQWMVDEGCPAAIHQADRRVRS